MGFCGASAWVRNRAQQLGAPGAAWLAELPDVVADLQRQWALAVERELDGGTGSWVARVRRADGTPAVLKVALPDGSAAREGDVLRAADGRGYVRLLAAAPEHGAVLLELLGPSPASSELAPERQIAVLCDLLRDAWPVPRPADLDPEPTARDLADPAYDVGVVLRDWSPHLLGGDPVALADRYARLAAVRTGLDRTAIAEWAFLERVSTGLFVLQLGRPDVAAPFLETAGRLVQG